MDDLYTNQSLSLSFLLNAKAMRVGDESKLIDLETKEEEAKKKGKKLIIGDNYGLTQNQQ